MEEPSESEWKSLLQTPMLVVKKLEDPILLTGTGAAVLLAIIAIFAPGDKSIYVWPIAGLILLVCVISAIIGARRDRAAAAKGAIGNTVTGSGHAVIEKIDQRAADAGSNTVGGRGHAQISGVTQSTSAPSTVAAPTVPTVPTTTTPPAGVRSSQASALPELVIEAVPVPSQRVPSDDGSSAGGKHAFVGRRAEIDEVIGLLDTRHDGTVVDIVGVRGVGKSSLLHQLRVRAAAAGATVRAINMAELVDGFRDDQGDDASVAVLEHVFNHSAQLMRTLTDGTGWSFDEVWRQLETQRQAVQLNIANSVEASGRGQASAVNQTVNITVGPVSEEQARRSVQDAQAAIDRAFVEAWTAAVGPDDHMLATFDSFERCADDELGRWIIRMALRLPNMTMVVGRLPQTRPLSIASERLIQRRLANFTLEEVEGYLVRRTLGTAIDPEVVTVVHDFTAGHPGGVYLMGELIIERGGEAATASSLKRVLTRLPSEPQKAWGKLADEIVTSVRDQSALRAAAVVSTIDQAMLAELMAEPGAEPSPQDATNALTALNSYGLLIQVRTPDGREIDRYRMHEFIRQSVAARLRNEDYETWQRMHASAAAFLFRALQAGEDGDDETDGEYGSSGTYGAWYKYEHPDWQWYKRQWLYHAGQRTDRRSVTRTQFALVFFEAFWWWGVYLDFDFNRHLLDDWDRAAAAWQPHVVGPLASDKERAADERFGDALRFVLTFYPTTHVKPATAPWAEIGDQLLLIRDLCDVDRARAAEGTEQADETATLDAFISLFLAHTYRFADPHDDHADRAYARARTGFVDAEDAWTVAWIDQERADLELDRGHLDGIDELLAETAVDVRDIALEDGPDSWDFELMANLHRVHADSLWLRGDVAEAAHAYGRALADAYWFQGGPHPADRYTAQFYAEITGRIGLRTLELAADDAPAAIAFVQGIQSEFAEPRKLSAEAIGEILASGQLQDVIAGLFPPGPTTEELVGDRAGSRFMARWRRARLDARDPEETLAPLMAAAQPGADGG